MRSQGRNVDERMMKRNREIELLRFLFASMIVLKHSQVIYDPEQYHLFLKGSFAVEFFFVLSGYLMMRSLNKVISRNENIDIVESTLYIIKKKALSMYPNLFIINILGFFMIAFTDSQPIKDNIIAAVKAIPSDYFFLRMFLLSEITNGPLWYFSSMLICMLIMVPMILKSYNLASK